MKKQIMSCLLTLALAAMSACAEIVVDYNPPTSGNVYGRSADVDTLTGDTWNFSDMTALVTEDGTGQNGTLYGGVKTTWSVGQDYDPVFKHNGTYGFQVQVIPPVTCDTTAKGIYIWKKEDFLVGSGSTVVFNSGDSMSLNVGWVKGAREIRFVVNQAGTYYISEDFYDDSAEVDPTATQWAVLNTNDFSWSAFTARTLNDVRGVGLYYDVSNTASFCAFRINDFQLKLFYGVPVSPVGLANIFSSGCVLQRDQTTKIWGTCTPNDTITAEVNAQSKQTVADTNGHWQVELDPEPAGGPYTLTVSGEISDPVVLTEVYFGDVWILTGQSNMFQMLRGQTRDWAEYYPPVPDETDDFDDVRFAIISTVESTEPVDDVVMSVPWNRWEGGSNMGMMSTVGYFFTRALNEALDANGMADVPIGIIKVCRGATGAEQWISAEALAAMPEPVISDNLLSGYYNGMIEPIQDYAIKGALWYQGENNSNPIERVEQYPLVMQTLIESWREEWGIDFPFYYVQLAPHKDFSVNPSDQAWAWLRESQTETLAVANTGMACIIDIGFQANIHPPFKDIVGQRLANIALADTYGFDLVTRGPTFSGVVISNSTVTITFDNVVDGLRTQAVDAKPDEDEIADGDYPVSVSSNVLAGFALCGADQTFYWATEAEIVGTNQVRISNSVDVPDPEAVRYAWQNFPRCNLFNSEGLPAEPFRTDTYVYETSGGAALTQPPAAPTGLAATAGDSSVSLDWADNSEPNPAASYRVYRSTTSGSYGAALAIGLASSEYIDNTAVNDTTYYYVVTATDTAANESVQSAEASATPTTPPPCGDPEGDINGDCKVDLLDLQMMVTYWLQAVFTECSQCDINGDGDINLKDYSTMCQNWHK